MLNFLKQALRSRRKPQAGNPRRSTAARFNPTRPLLLSIERLAADAQQLAHSHQVGIPQHRRSSLLLRLERTSNYLATVYKRLIDEQPQTQLTVPAAEWLLDNYYIVQEQIAEVRVDLPARYYNQLPKLVDGPTAGYPRIYALARALIVASDGQLNLERVVTFTRAYQAAGAPLTMGELWSVAIMLRLCLVERLGRLAAQMLAVHDEWLAADEQARQLLEAAEQRLGEPVAVPAGLRERKGPLSPIFATRLHRLREQGETFMPVLDWLSERLYEQGTSLTEMVQLEIRLLGGIQESVGNVITSMKTISALDWASFVEDLSVVEATLRGDPARVYAEMDFTTRDRYRHEIERLARQSQVSELEVATLAVEFAAKAQAAGKGLAANASLGEPPLAALESYSPPESLPPFVVDDRQSLKAHVGYYIIDDGRMQLEQRIGYRPTPLDRVARVVEHYPTRLYLGTLAAVSGALVGGALAYARRQGATRLGTLGVAAVAALPASSLATSLVNYLITTILPPRPLPRLDFERGIPAELRTFVVIPVLISSEAGVRELLSHIEVLALANPDPSLHFAILSDFADADQQYLPSDSPILDRLVSGTNDLNARYPGQNRFYLFHRDRAWNQAQGKWMGWERKRGKLMDLNRRLLGDPYDSFTVKIGDMAVLPHVRYVITLDADTELPPAAPHRLVGTIAHPLNQPLLNHERGLVERGYGVLQPRVTTTLLSGNSTPFARLTSGHSGVDPYTTAVSDVYQDLFKEGIFMGKGIYDVRAFEGALRDRFAQNKLLSHDLIEGLYSRAGLATDVTLYDDQPGSYLVAARRSHRWVRGDWQIAPWLFNRVPAPQGQTAANVITPIGRWKIFDNLRRSLESPGLLAMLLAGWTVLPGSPALWTGLAAFVRAFPTVANLVATIPRKPPATAWPWHLNYVLHETGLNLLHLGINTTMLVDQAGLMLDAVGRTLWRVAVSHRNLLEWQTAADSQRKLKNDLPAYLKWLWQSPLVATSVGGLLLRFRPRALPVAAPFLAAWAAAPLVAWRVSQPTPPLRTDLSTEQSHYLREVARQTWRYFDTLVGPADNWLAPDNYQEDKNLIAHRTSPTNMSLALLSTLAARDFGFITTTSLVERLGHSLASMERLERHRGHFYNWYDTQTMQPLLPTYISTVDSGNLAGHLVALKQGCLLSIDEPLVAPGTVEGLQDVTRLLAAALTAYQQHTGRLTATTDALYEQLAQLDRLLERETSDHAQWSVLLDEVAALAGGMVATVGRIGAGADGDELRYWATQLGATAQSAADQTHTLLPWAGLLATLPPAPDSDHYPEIARLWQAVALPEYGLSLSRGLAWYVDTLPRLRQLRTAIVRGGLPAAEAAARLPWLEQFNAAVAAAWSASESLIYQLREIARRCQAMIEMMRFDFLYDEGRDLFAIGYNVAEQRRDGSYYDLLASEARLASFLAIARGEVPIAHWFKLGRARTHAAGSHALLSWTGTMFEYLMPNLVLRSYPNTLIEQSSRAAVGRQQQYGRERNVPWGISESAYNLRDQAGVYQYRAFGVPGLGLKRGLANDLVVAPYATMLALLVNPPAAVANLRRLQLALGRYGFYDAVDYTPGRLPENTDHAIVLNYMVHHQGMSLLALDGVLHGAPMIARFHNEPAVQAVELLLQERIPLQAPIVQPHIPEVEGTRPARRLPGAATPNANVRHFETAATPQPEAQLLSNGEYHLMLTNSGSGYALWKDLAVTRWRKDATLDHYGQFIYLRDTRSGQYWSAGWQPTATEPEGYGATFGLEQVSYWRRDSGIETLTRVVVSPDEAAELRVVTLSNYGNRPREIEVTSYAEVVLSKPEADAAHPAFSKLFIETEFLEGPGALLASRRPRSHKDPRYWLTHVVATQGDVRGELEYETDRARFIGRGQSSTLPVALEGRTPLSKTVGAVLDPIVSLRRRVRLAPGQQAILYFTTAVGLERAEVVALANRYANPAAGERALQLAAQHSELRRRRHDLSISEAMLYQQLASRILFTTPALRPASKVLATNTKGQPGLWAYGISGDAPIVLLLVQDIREAGLLQELLRAHEYITAHGLVHDLVVVNEYDLGYQQPLNDLLWQQIMSSPEAEMLGQRGGVHLLRADNMPAADLILFRTVAQMVLTGGLGSLAEQLDNVLPTAKPLPAFQPSDPRAAEMSSRPRREDTNPLPTISSEDSKRPAEAQAKIYDNGIGGFSADGREYVINLEPGLDTPTPWSNVLANADFGCLTTESGAGTTWAQNSRENRLTPWHNDPVSDPPSEAIYLRDDASGALWSATPLPIRQPLAYTVRHGWGYSSYQHTSHEIEQELTLFVPPDAPLKIWRLQLKNLGPARHLTATHYLDWVLGVSREGSSRYVISEWDEQGTMLARNPYNNEFAGAVAFVTSSQTSSSYTADRAEFLGRNGGLADPAALHSSGLSNRVGADLDPCSAIQSGIDLPAGGEVTILFVVGEAEDRAAALALAARYRQPAVAAQAWQQTIAHWQEITSAVQVETPDPAMDLMLNGWLLYQAVACRYWARSAFYQGGGAYGFRDQLQDVMAFVYSRPDLAREQLVRAIQHQFKEGDVQHWWHPPTGRGVRTRFSDDLLWLPFVTAFYIKATGDQAILAEAAPYLQADVLQPGQEDAYLQPATSEESGTLYDHCVRALKRGATSGRHGLPLMGAGDWNDGMNHIGIEGEGESVWLAWFLVVVLERFAGLAVSHDDAELAAWCRAERVRLTSALETQAWDGGWYRRAYFDDGTPLGSAQNDECQIDAIAQSWSVIAGTGDPARARQAMAAVDRRLVWDDEQLLLLLTPAFDKGALDPGYIKGYLPGVRENGGQYTHAATWTILAFALLGNGKRAHELWSMVNPISHSHDAAAADHYKVEPYVVAADVYSHPQHLGRGGWTWYTGSGSWLYRVGLEAILGFTLHGDHFTVKPTIPPDWPGYQLHYRYHSTTYHVAVQRNAGGPAVSLDGVTISDGRIPLHDDGREHQVSVTLAA